MTNRNDSNPYIANNIEEKTSNIASCERPKQQKLKEQEYSKEFSDSMKNDDIYAEGCNIFDIQNKTLTQILKEINDKYN